VIDHAGDTDIHQVALIEGLTYEIEVLGSDGGGGSLADPELRLRDSGGRTIAADNSDSGAGSDDLLEFTPEASGRHYVDVRGFGTGTGSYQVAVSEGLGTAAADMIDGTSSADAVDALGGEDRVSGAKGDDMLLGGGGSDELKGGRGDDVLTGGLDADTMTGGGGADVFAFTLLEDSTAPDRDTILPGSKGVALGKPGAEAGDLIDLTAIDADATLIGDQAFVFGSIGTVAGLWLVEEGDLTVVRASVDADADAEFELAISDGSIRATDYTSDDFAL
jgi:Ca2+-binding RTX toxin-like protein